MSDPNYVGDKNLIPEIYRYKYVKQKADESTKEEEIFEHRRHLQCGCIESILLTKKELKNRFNEWSKYRIQFKASDNFDTYVCKQNSDILTYCYKHKTELHKWLKERNLPIF